LLANLLKSGVGESKDNSPAAIVVAAKEARATKTVEARILIVLSYEIKN